MLDSLSGYAEDLKNGMYVFFLRKMLGTWYGSVGTRFFGF